MPVQPPPTLGQRTEKVLGGLLGCSPSDIQSLRKAGPSSDALTALRAGRSVVDPVFDLVDVRCAERWTRGPAARRIRGWHPGQNTCAFDLVDQVAIGHVVGLDSLQAGRTTES